MVLSGKLLKEVEEAKTRRFSADPEGTNYHALETYGRKLTVTVNNNRPKSITKSRTSGTIIASN